MCERYMHIWFTYFLLEILLNYSNNFMSMLVAAWLIILILCFRMLDCILLSMARLYLSPANQHKKLSKSGINKDSKYISAESSDMDNLSHALIMPPLLQMEHWSL